MNNSKLEIKHIILIIMLILTIFLALFTVLVDDNRKLTPIEKIIKDGVIFIQRIIYSPFIYIDTRIDKYIDMQNVYKENKELKANIEKYELIKNENLLLKKEINELKMLTNIEHTLIDYTYLNATVINRNIGYWYNSITINKGSFHGVSEDMAVITNRGLIGKIIKTSIFNSEVKLITNDDLNSKISAGININDRTIHGLISGYNYDKNLLIMDGIVENADFTQGLSVYTTGFGGIFPRGILIGKIEEIEYDKYGLSKRNLIKSEVDFNNLSFVTILRRKAP